MPVAFESSRFSFKRSLEGAGVGHAQDGAGLLDVVRDPTARLGPGLRRQAVVAVQAEAEVELEIAHLDAVLDVERVLVDVGGGVKVERTPVAREIEGQQAGEERRTGQVGVVRRGRPVSGGSALAGAGERGIGNGVAAGIDTGRVESRVGNTEAEILQQAGLLQVDAIFQILTAECRGDVRFHAPIEKLPVLALGGGEIVERVGAGIVVQLIFTHVWIHGQQGACIDGVLITGSDAPAQHALALVLRQLVIIVGDLEPVAGREEIQVEHVLAVGLVIHTVEDGLAVAGVVNVCKLGRVEETLGSDKRHSRSYYGGGLMFPIVVVPKAFD
jgi:hypothetical protein